MMYSEPYQDYELKPEVVKALDLIFLLHADHEQNCSTSTVRMVASSQANLFASAAAGVCALWGPLHLADPLLDIGKKLEEAALHDSYFVERKLYPNVDFYSGIIMRAIGIPTEMFTVIFAIGRMPGWIANFKEIMDEPKTRIYRPRQIYVGPALT